MHRYRKLTGRLDWAAISSIQRAGSYTSSRIPSWDDVRAEHGKSSLPVVDAPRRVEVSEGQASLEDLDRMVRTGALRPEDLVEWEGRWTPFDLVFHFDDACEAAKRRRRRRHAVVTVAAAILVPLLAYGALRGFIWLVTGGRM